MEIITNKIYICLPNEKEIDKLDWDGLSTEEYNGKTYYKIPSGGGGKDVVKKITFETLKDNVTVTLNIVSSSEADWDFSYACDLDGTYGYSNAKYKMSGNNKSIACKYVVPTKGSHWIYIGYRKDGSGNYYNDCGYFSIDNSDKEYIIRQPKEVYLASDKMNEITYGSKKILEYRLTNTISWETLTWDKSSNSYTYNTNGPIKMHYNITSVSSSSETLNKSPSKLPSNGEIYKLTFYPGITSNNTYIMPYKIDLSDWNTSYVHDMGSMFYNCDKLATLDVSRFNTSKVTNMSWMFGGCKSLTSLNMPRLDTSNVTNMYCMFYNCNKLATLDVSRFNTSKVTNMGWMFYSCDALTSLDLSGWNTSKVTDMSNMFGFCTKLKTLDVSGFDTTKVTDMNNMFCVCTKLKTLDVSGFDTTKVTDMSNMFRGCEEVTSLDVSGWNTSNVTNMEKMIWYLNNITYLDVSGWNTSNVTNMDYMFCDCRSLESLDLSRWNVSKVTSAKGILQYSPRLKTIIAGHESEPNVTALNGLKLSINLIWGHMLNYESIYALFRGVAKVTTTQTITLPKVMQGKLDATKVKIATDKGWTIAYE